MGNFRARITKSLIDRLQPGDYVSDISLNGFAARCQNVCVSYVVKVSINNRAKLFTIGKHGQPWTPDAARKRAMEIKCDPYAAMKEKIKNPTVKELAKPFIEDHLSTLKTSTRNDYTSIFNNKILTFFKSTDVRSIKRVDCSKFHRKYAATPRMANYSLAVLSVFLNWCEEMGCRDENSNPCFKIKRFPEVERQRYLTDQEVIAIGKALRELEQKGDISIYAGAAIRLLVLSGARKNEILALKHEYINYQQKIAYLPDSKTGQKKIKLNGPALNIIKSLPRHIKNEYVIVGRRKGQPLVNISKPWMLICEEANIKDCRIHDLRHSFASILAENEADLLMIGDLFGHMSPKTTKRYVHLTRSKDRVTSVNSAAGEHIDTLMNSPTSENT